MPLTDDLEVLADFGLFNEAAVEKLANLIRTVQSLADGKAPMATLSQGPGIPARGVGRPRGRPRGPGRPAGTTPQAAEGPGKRAKRGSFNVTKEELAKLRETFTAKEIGEKFGVSPMTVAQRASKLGLTSPRKGKGKK
jgi:hypothetical protein